MKDIIMDLSVLETPAYPLEFLTESGIDDKEGIEIIENIKEVMVANPDIIALAAPQIGYNKRIFCLRFEDTIKAFINPIITKKTGCTITAETFSSLPGKEILIARPEEISAVYYTDAFKYEDNKMLGFAARIFDQQVQLLDGVLPTSLGLVSDIEQDGSIANATEEELNQIIELYKKFVALKLQAAEAAIESEDEEAIKQYNQLKFTESVINGRTQVIADDSKYMQQKKARERKIQQAENKQALKAFLRRKKK